MPPAVNAAAPTRSRRLEDFLGYAWGLLLGVMPLADYAAGPPIPMNEMTDAVNEQPLVVTSLLAMALLGTLVPGAVAAVRLGADWRRARLFVSLAALNLLVIAASYYGLREFRAFLYIPLVACAFLSAGLYSAVNARSDRLLDGMFVGLAAGLIGSLGWVVYDAHYEYGRLFGHSTPNYYGLIGIACFFAGVAVRNYILKAAAIGLACTVLYLCGARGSMFACAAGGVAMFALFLGRATPRKRLIYAVGALGLVVLGLAVFGGVIADRVLLLNDQYRGLKSGASGRAAAWAETFYLFETHPWLGVGYRQHGNFLSTLATAHNGFLAILADTGIIGLVAYLSLVLTGLVRAVQRALRQPSWTRFAVVGLIVAYLTVSMTERLGLNTGNPLSLLMLFTVAWSLRARASERSESSPSRRRRSRGGRGRSHRLAPST